MLGWMEQHMIPLATTLVSGFVAIIAFLHWREARSKLVLDLYDRRIAFCRSSRRFLVAVVNQPEPKHEDLLSFASEVEEARFLFGLDIRQFLDRAYLHALEAIARHQQMYPRHGNAGLPVGPERQAVSQRFTAEVTCLSRLFQDAESEFAPYFYLGAATVPGWRRTKARLRTQARKSWARAKDEVGRAREG